MRSQYPHAETTLNHGGEISFTYLSFRAQQALGTIPDNVVEW